MKDLTGVTLADIKQARQFLSGIAHHTPLEYSFTFSKMTGCKAYLKLENLQKTGSFKIRGAYNKIRSLLPEESINGVIAASAGNHAQGVAYAAASAKIAATIVMPQMAPLAKIMATKGYGAEVILAGNGYDEAFQQAKELQKEKHQTLIHAFDDPYVIAGQGTVGLEILDDLSDIDTIVVPIGGGGLLAGIAVAVKEQYPKIKIVGVEAVKANAIYLSQKKGYITPILDAVTMADGIAVKVPGEIPFSIIKHYVDDVVLVDDETIAGTILLLLERAKLVTEGAGAISLAALLSEKVKAKGKIVSILSGGNIDVQFISRIIERGLVKAGRRITISTKVIDKAGALKQLLSIFARYQANVVTVYHNRTAKDVPIGQALVKVALETQDYEQTQEILAGLRQEGYIIENIDLERGI